MNKHNAMFLGEERRKLYAFDHDMFLKKDCDDYVFRMKTRVPQFYDYEELNCMIEFLREEIDYPPIEIGEEIYVEGLDKEIKVTDRVRNLDGGYVYKTDYVVKVVEDGLTEESRKKAMEDVMKYKQKCKQEQEEAINEKKWYQFWK